MIITRKVLVDENGDIIDWDGPPEIHLESEEEREKYIKNMDFFLNKFEEIQQVKKES